MYIDTHAHLYLNQFDEDRDAVIDRARKAGIDEIIVPAIDIPSIYQALALCDAHDGLYAMVALHPSETKSATEADFDVVRALCDDPRVVAVGESGLDYYWDRSFDEIQHDFFRRHIRLAIEKELPLIIHNRDATDDLVRIIREERADSVHPEQLRGIFHCFGGPGALAGEILEMGFLVGIGGTLTFKNSGVADEIASVPMEQIVLETDAPFLAPAPHRGKRNEPANVRLVAEKLADVKGLTVDEVGKITSENARKLFRLSPDPS